MLSVEAGPGYDRVYIYVSWCALIGVYIWVFQGFGEGER